MSKVAVTRRNLLSIGAIGLSGLTLGRLAAAAGESDRSGSGAAGRARSCILIYLDGGPSHIDLFDLKPDAPAEIRGPFGSIATSVPGIRICEHLPHLTQQMHRVLQVRSMRHEETVHDPAVYQMLTGYEHISSAGDLSVEPTDMPCFGSALYQADRRASVMPPVVALPDKMKMGSRVLPGQGAGILSPAFEPWWASVSRDGQAELPALRGQDELPRRRLLERRSLVERFNGELGELTRLADVDRLDRFRTQALEIVASPHVQAAFDLDREAAAVRDRYGRHRHGQSVLLARRLIEAGTRLVTVYWGSEDQDWADGRGLRPANNPWDTHRNHFPLTKDSLCPRADQALAALLEDLAQRGLLESTLVVWMGDFGRTPYISKPWASRDHWPQAFTILLAGGGTRGGQVYGSTDRHAAEVIDDPVSPADLTATLFAALGVDPAQVIPATDGRPHRLSTGRVIDAWFG